MTASSYYSRTLVPSRVAIHELLELAEAARKNSRTMLADACRLEGRTLVIPSKVFARMAAPSTAVLEVALVAGRLMVWTSTLPPSTNCYANLIEPEVRLSLPDSFPLEEARALLKRPVVFVSRQKLLVGTPEDVPTNLGGIRRVRRLEDVRTSYLQRDMLCNINTSFELTRDRVTVWLRQSTKGCKCVQLAGGGLSVLGWKPDEHVRMTKYANGVLVERCASSVATTQLTAPRRNPDWHPEPFVPGINIPMGWLGQGEVDEIVEFVVGDALFVAVGSPDLAAVCVPKRNSGHRARSRCELAQPSSIKLAAANGMEVTVYRIGELYFRRELLRRKGARAGATPNSAVYPIPADRARLQLQGEWLKDFGFEVGTRYNAGVSDVVNRLIVEACADGQYSVTAMSKDSDVPKLYVPAGMLPWKAGWVRAIGTSLGLVFRAEDNPRRGTPA